METVNLISSAKVLPAAWRSNTLGPIGTARLKILRMDALPVCEEVHDYNEALIVLEGEMTLVIGGLIRRAQAGEMLLVPAGTAHSVAAGSSGTLLIVDES